ncbi:MAG: hypothetical protein ACFFC0_00770 [Promethearchaeota archaeon]
MREKTVLLAFILTMSLVIPIAFVSVGAAATAEFPEYIGVDLESGLAGESYMPDISEATAEAASGEAYQYDAAVPVGTTVYDWYINAISGSPYMTLRAVSEFAEVWVQDDLSYPDGDPRNDDPYLWQVTDEQCQYLADEFDAVIYQKCTEFFGFPEDRDGTGSIFEAIGWPAFTYDWFEATDNPQRTIIKVLNYQDENYFDPTYPYYVIGFYSSTYTKDYYNRNMIHIDNWAWYQRVGAEGTQWYPDDRPELVVTLPYTYEGTIAHEYQHLIHRDYQASPEAFMNEGCSMFAEVLCGYGIPWSHINSYLATPDNSLTAWEDQGGINVLADYGAAALWAIYLSDHYGAEFLSYYVGAGIAGIEGINAALAYFGYTETFDDIFHDWKLANLIHSDFPGGGKYNYVTLDLGGEDAEQARVYEIEKLPVPTTFGSDFGTTVTILGYDTGVTNLGPYASDYIALTKWQKQKPWMKQLAFDGDDFAQVPGWTLTDGLWYSGAANLMNTLIFGEAFVDPADPTLMMYTYWDIEDYWDFGFVQVSTDGGMTWTSLENAYTTYDHDSGAIDTAVNNLPGLTGWSEDFLTLEFDLSAYAGTDVLVGFRYVTDWNTLYEGWYIEDSVTVSGEYVELGPYLPEADFQVTLVYYTKFKGDYFPFFVWDLDLDSMTEEGTSLVMPPHRGYVVLVVSAVQNSGLADYSFNVDFKHKWDCSFWGE